MATQLASIKRLAAPLEAFVVDGFNFQARYPDVRHWFLSHAHSDHVCGLTSTFDAGTIYCSGTTVAAIERDVSPALRSRCVIVEVGECVEIEGCRVRALDAGHCPGSLLFAFEKDGYRALHTGDFRASEAVRAQFGDSDVGFDRVYLDTTYASPRWDFPAQEDACRTIAEVVASSPPRTLFVVGTYSLGKENAVDAAIRASGGLGYVPKRRAEALRFCGRWDDSLHCADKDDPRVRVWVEGVFGGGGGGGSTAQKKSPHERLLAVLENSRFDAVCSLRCTGWEFRRGKAYSEWVENDGQTRCVGVPYSEHSSFLELKAFVRQLRPREVVPTVNAETREARRALRDLFVAETDLRADVGKLDSFLCRRRGGGGGGGLAAAAEREQDPLRRVNVRQQRRLLDATRGARAPTNADERQVARLAEVLPGAPKAYLAQLLRDSSGDVDGAVAIHFGPNEGRVVLSDAIEETEENLLVGAVFEVRGADADFKLFKGTEDATKKRKQNANGAADKIRKRLRELGATVVDQNARADKKLAPTHLVVPEGADPDALRNFHDLVVVKTESWLVRKFRALRNGTVDPPTPDELRRAASLGTTTRRRKDVSACGEKRRGPLRIETAETRALRERALNERMYLVARRDETPAGFASGSPVPKHVFAVMGSTGNVYEVTLYFEPKCTCPFATSHPTKVCKHRFFVLCKVLAVPEDYDYLAYQRFLRSDELRAILRRTEDASIVASTVARAAYGRASRGEDLVDDRAPAVAATSRELLASATCCVCFDSFAADENHHEWCRACGKNLHGDCLQRWLARHPTCPACRVPWTATDGQASIEEGFLNLRDLQPGVAHHRDTSTYAVDAASGRHWMNLHADRRADEPPP
ncbi:hypothetical protein CTAYLR_008379 [Chrysophaeum taylorii]|uniref:SWIM-type domain-containing protein n=1 Tax=Chrysophaeum taylorii TaxID=2483200 RepID=A0AAD7UI91_9STRA|nr:hypothetical protein CTAYLR_008379 [Chrysophaeum taylorii]